MAGVEQQLKDDIDQLLQRVEPQLRTLETRLNGTEKAPSEPAPNRAQRRAAERSKAKREPVPATASALSQLINWPAGICGRSDPRKEETCSRYSR